MELIYSGTENTTKWNEKNGVAFITFRQLDSLGVKHGFSTRLGGVSKDGFSAMNLSFTRGDEEEAVNENHERFAKAIGYDVDKLVFSDQVHNRKVYRVKLEDTGKGIVKESDIRGIDGLVTNVKDVPLITFYADCVPLFFYDPIQKVVALSHSGWKGTALRIGKETIRVMREGYGCRPEDVYVAIGPSICGDCYEIGEDVAVHFKKEFTEEENKCFLKDVGNGKYFLDLWKANELILLKEGISKEKLSVTDLCTCHNPKAFHSHRASKGERGSLAAVITL